MSASVLGLPRSPRKLLGAIRSDSLIRNSVAIMAVTVVTSVLGFVFWLVAARRFNADQVGISAALVSTMTLVSLLSNLGINTALVQMLPRREPGAQWSATLNAGVLLGSASGFLAGLAAVFLLPLFSSNFDLLSRPGYLAIFVGGVIATTVTNLIDYACIAERRAEKTLIRNTVFSVVKIPVLLVPFVVAMGTFGIFVSWVIATAVTVGVGATMIPRLGRGYRLLAPGLREQLGTLRTYIAGHHSINIGNFAPWWLLPLFVTIQVSSAAAAYFYATWRICGLLFLISPSVASALTAEGAHSPRELLTIAARSQRTIMAMLIPACVLMAAAGHWILAAFGSEYASEGLPLLLLFTVAALPDSVMDVWVAVLRVEGRLRFGSALQLGTAAVALALSWVLLPPLGLTGAGVAWLASRLLGLAIVAWDFRRQAPRRAALPVEPADGAPAALLPTDIDGAPTLADEPGFGSGSGAERA